jgi:hypothetical protein
VPGCGLGLSVGWAWRLGVGQGRAWCKWLPGSECGLGLLSVVAGCGVGRAWV